MSRILVVEDSPTQAEQLRWSLEEAGFEIDVAHNAEHALEIFDPDRFDMVVSDIVMPGASGYELCEKIKASNQDVPVVLLSALTDPMTIIRALECGADNFLTKPYEPQHLVSRVHTALSNKALRAAGKFKLGIEVMFLGKKFMVGSDKEQILDLLMSTFEDIIRANAELEASKEELAAAKSTLEQYTKKLEARVAERTNELRKRQRQLSDAQEIAKMGDWHLDTASDELRLSDQVSDILGQDRAALGLGRASMMALLHPADHDRVEAAFIDAQDRKQPYQTEARFRSATGKERVCWIIGNPECDSHGNVIGMFGIIQDVTERKLMEAQILASGERYKRLFEDIPDGVVVVVDGLISLANAAALSIFGLDQLCEIEGRRIADFIEPEFRNQGGESRSHDWANNGTIAQISGRLTRSDGGCVPVEVTCSTNETTGSWTRHFIIRDVSQRRRVEEQLFQAQKMEAVGQLTGGISHDFNNILAIIIGNLDLAREDIIDGDAADALSDALEAAVRGADLNQRLLAFARRQTLLPKRTSVNELIITTSKLLERALGEQIELRLCLEDGLESALVDSAQLESAITNLAVNARDAMAGGGQLIIKTSRQHITGQDIEEQALSKSGDYIVVEVSDTGGGMTPDVLQRACEPFFTTKEEGKGTGLGLSMVHGFMEQSRGMLRIDSKIDKGTVVRLFLPRATEDGESDQVLPAAEIFRAQGEVILVVEDNDSLRRVLTKQLHALGYETIEAGHGESALEILRSQQRIDLLLTDLVMPGGIDGRQLAESAAEFRPGLKAVLTSGFSEAALGLDAHLQESEFLLRKPYRREELAQMLRNVLSQ